MTKNQILSDALSLIFQGIERLNKAFPNRSFTIDGRLVGDIGEVIAGLEYALTLDDVSQPDYDGVTLDGRKVQIKATFKDHLTFKSIPDYFLGFKIYPDGSYEEVFNGPGVLIYEKYSHRKGVGSSLLSFPNRVLRELSMSVPDDARIARRTS